MNFELAFNLQKRKICTTQCRSGVYSFCWFFFLFLSFSFSFVFSTFFLIVLIYFCYIFCTYPQPVHLKLLHIQNNYKFYTHTEKNNFILHRQVTKQRITWCSFFHGIVFFNAFSRFVVRVNKTKNPFFGSERAIVYYHFLVSRCYTCTKS